MLISLYMQKKSPPDSKNVDTSLHIERHDFQGGKKSRARLTCFLGGAILEFWAMARKGASGEPRETCLCPLGRLGEMLVDERASKC